MMELKDKYQIGPITTLGGRAFLSFHPISVNAVSVDERFNCTKMTPDIFTNLVFVHTVKHDTDSQRVTYAGKVLHFVFSINCLLGQLQQTSKTHTSNSHNKIFSYLTTLEFTMIWKHLYTVACMR